MCYFVVCYCATVFGVKFSVQNHKEIQKLQNRCARAGTGIFDHDISSASLIKNLHLMNIENKFMYFTSLIVFKSLNNLNSSYFSEKFEYISKTQPYLTRQAQDNKLHITKYRTNLYSKSLSIRGAQIWNSVPNNVRQCNTLTEFKSTAKMYM